MPWSTSEIRMRLAIRETGLSPPVKYFYWLFESGASFVDHLCCFCLVCVMLSWAYVYWCLVVTCWERADLLAALVCDVWLWSCHFPIGIPVQVCCLIVSIPDFCPLSYVLYHKTASCQKYFDIIFSRIFANRNDLFCEDNACILYIKLVSMEHSGWVVECLIRDRGCEPHLRHCVVSLSMTHLSLLSTGPT